MVVFRFMVFAGAYDSNTGVGIGGWHNFVGSNFVLNGAVAIAKQHLDSASEEYWAHIADQTTGEIVWYGNNLNGL